MAEVYLGDVCVMSFNFAPRWWAECNGQLLPISQNQALYTLLSNRFGGDGKTTFGLPALPPVPAQNGKTMNYYISLRGEYPPQ